MAARPVANIRVTKTLGFALEARSRGPLGAGPGGPPTQIFGPGFVFGPRGPGGTQNFAFEILRPGGELQISSLKFGVRRGFAPPNSKFRPRNLEFAPWTQNFEVEILSAARPPRAKHETRPKI